MNNRYDATVDRQIDLGVMGLSGVNAAVSQEISRTIGSGTRTVREIAGNSTIANLLSLPDLADGGAVGVGFARNFLTAEANRSALFASAMPEGFPADIRSSLSAGGIAVVDPQGRIIVSSIGAPLLSDLPAPDATLRRSDDASADSVAPPISFHTIVDQTYAVFRQPVPGQGLPVENTDMGGLSDGDAGGAVVTGLAPVERISDAFLRSLASVADTSMVVSLVLTDGDQHVVIAGNYPGAPGLLPSPSTGSGSAAGPGGATQRTATSAVEAPGDVRSGIDWRGAETIGVALPVNGAPLAVVAEFNPASITDPLNVQRHLVLAACLLTGLLLTLLGLYARRLYLGHAYESTALTAQVTALESRNENLMLRSILDNVEDRIVVRDGDQNIIFRNKSHILADKGKPDFQAVNGPQAGHHETYDVPLISNQAGGHSLLTVSRDLSKDASRQIQQKNNVEGVLFSIIGELDKRDPNASDHSRRVSETATTIARRLGLDAETVDLIGFAGRLLNLGKLRVSKDILGDSSEFTETTKAMIRNEIASVSDMLTSGLEPSLRNGPLIPMIEQAFERLDGSGFPKGLRAEDIGVPARILAVANTYVALTSPRPHRPALSHEKAMDIIMSDSPQKFDPQIAGALLQSGPGPR